MSAVVARNTRPMACPSCRKYHIDEGEWAERAHYTHRCVNDAAGPGCGAEWTIEGHAVFGVMPAQIAPWIRTDARLVWRLVGKAQRQYAKDILCIREILEIRGVPRATMEVVRGDGISVAIASDTDRLAIMCKPALAPSIGPLGQELLADLAAEHEEPDEPLFIQLSTRQTRALAALHPGVPLSEAVVRTINQLAKSLLEAHDNTNESDDASKVLNDLADIAVAWRELGERIFVTAADIERAATMGGAEPALQVAEDAREVGRDLLGVAHAIDVDDLKAAKSIVAPRRRHRTSDFDVVVRDYAHHAAGAATASIVDLMREGERGLDTMKEMLA